MTTDGDAPLQGRTILMSGGSRGHRPGDRDAGRARRRQRRAAGEDREPHPRLEGTIHTAAAEIEAAGGQRAARSSATSATRTSIVDAVKQTVETFGGIDIVVNNASAIDLSPSTDLAAKKFDLMQQIEVRGTFLLTRTRDPPPARVRPRPHPHALAAAQPVARSGSATCVGYMLAKYGMTLAALGFAAELEQDGIASNTLWPRTMIATAAVLNLLGGDEAMAQVAHARRSWATPHTRSSPGRRWSRPVSS